uniref:Uncharacterized protein n=1 Tax=Arundo donax TaxID=35708 RepID=A0A0A9C7W3_ARUDO
MMILKTADVLLFEIPANCHPHYSFLLSVFSHCVLTRKYTLVP